MSGPILSVGLLGLLFLLLGLGVWVAWSLITIGVVSLAAFTNVPTGKVMATALWSASSQWALVSLPLFIWMGEILSRTRVMELLFSALSPLLRNLPGGLIHTNIVGSGVFATVSGSSSATCVTVGKLTIPALRERGYADREIIGTLTSASALGLMIPPSIGLIVYGVVAEVSIARLFLAGFLPGFVLMLMLMVVAGFMDPGTKTTEEPRIGWAEILRRGAGLFPILSLIVIVLGSIYGGYATPTEAAAVGVAGALVIALMRRELTAASFKEGVLGAIRTTCMIGFITVSAAFLSTAMGYTGIPRMLAESIASFGLSQIGLIVVLTLFFVVLGCFLEGMSLIVLTGAILTPIVTEAGIDPVWFGIYLIAIIEISLITPPVGLNLFVMQSLTGHEISSIVRAVFPYFLTLLAFVTLLVMFPELALFLPSLSGH
ncbi:TRAP transporter large permease [Futiania mangrovi]|uniref:TRAP transporter large permease protein n=1 Tax=Futiania mangrovi TaxID=2959716 RepID=A0A9J6PH64_9PROT|nr:TRAP transporter large permease subunit [Futiania mangrovii]MCP1337160.1 TRAP transporter large permease subunit [Futiania mangrovii]